MLADITGNVIPGQLKGPTENISIFVLVAFIETRLVEFSKKYPGSNIKNEKGLNQELCILLNLYSRKEGYPFLFEKEYMENVEKGNSAQVDIGVINIENKDRTKEEPLIHSEYYSSGKSFFSLEVKRLDNISKAREKEYVLGRFENGKYIDCGGMERFKKGIHGTGLRFGGMIGFVQMFDFGYWQHTINSWIDDLIAGNTPSTVNWTEKDRLSEINKTPITAQFQSENSRITGSIRLYHLWVNLVK